jgi:hypothetical protein
MAITLYSWEYRFNISMCGEIPSVVESFPSLLFYTWNCFPFQLYHNKFVYIERHDQKHYISCGVREIHYRNLLCLYHISHVCYQYFNILLFQTRSNLRMYEFFFICLLFSYTAKIIYVCFEVISGLQFCNI